MSILNTLPLHHLGIIFVGTKKMCFMSIDSCNSPLFIVNISCKPIPPRQFKSHNILEMPMSKLLMTEIISFDSTF